MTHDQIESKLSEAKVVVDGTVMYKAEVVKELNDAGVYLIFTSEGVRYSFS